MAEKQFELGDVLSVAKVMYLSRGGLGSIGSLLSFMVGYSVFTHEIAEAIMVCQPEILRQFPKLGEIEIPQKSIEVDWLSWVSALELEYGNTFLVTDIPQKRAESPFDSLARHFGAGKVIIVPESSDPTAIAQQVIDILTEEFTAEIT